MGCEEGVILQGDKHVEGRQTDRGHRTDQQSGWRLPQSLHARSAMPSIRLQLRASTLGERGSAHRHGLSEPLVGICLINA